MITSAKIKQQAVEAKRRESYTDNARLNNWAAYLTYFNYSPYYTAWVLVHLLPSTPLSHAGASPRSIVCS